MRLISSSTRCRVRPRKAAAVRQSKSKLRGSRSRSPRRSGASGSLRPDRSAPALLITQLRRSRDDGPRSLCSCVHHRAVGALLPPRSRSRRMLVRGCHGEPTRSRGVGNMWYLRVVGDNVEDRYGPLGYLGLYLLSGIAAALGQVAFSPDSITQLSAHPAPSRASWAPTSCCSPGPRSSMLFLPLFPPLRAARRRARFARHGIRHRRTLQHLVLAKRRGDQDDDNGRAPRLPRHGGTTRSRGAPGALRVQVQLKRTQQATQDPEPTDERLRHKAQRVCSHVQ